MKSSLMNHLNISDSLLYFVSGVKLKGLSAIMDYSHELPEGSVENHSSKKRTTITDNKLNKIKQLQSINVALARDAKWMMYLTVKKQLQQVTV